MSTIMFPSKKLRRFKQPPVVCDNVFFSAFMFLQCLYSFDIVDIITFTFDTTLLTDNLDIRRLIYNKAIHKIPSNIKSVQIDNLHTKMYFGYNYNYFDKLKLDSVFVGSWNFVRTNALECICKIPIKSNKYALEYFNNLWNQQ